MHVIQTNKMKDIRFDTLYNNGGWYAVEKIILTGLAVLAGGSLRTPRGILQACTIVEKIRK